jgi:hypothetical protein
MVNSDKEKNIEAAFEIYDKVREALSGLKTIMKINFRENDFYYQAGMDNLQALNDLIIDLLKNSYTPREVRMKLREIEYEDLETKSSSI